MKRWLGLALLPLLTAIPAASAVHVFAHGEMTFKVSPTPLEIDAPGLYHVSLVMEGRIRCDLPSGIGSPSSQLRLRPSPAFSENGSEYWVFEESQMLVGMTWRQDGASDGFVVRGSARLDIDSHAVSRVEQRSWVNFTRASEMGQASAEGCSLEEQEWTLSSMDLPIVLPASGDPRACDEVFPCHGETYAPIAEGEWAGRPRYVGSFGGSSRVPENGLFFFALVALAAVAVMGAWARRRR